MHVSEVPVGRVFWRHLYDVVASAPTSLPALNLSFPSFPRSYDATTKRCYSCRALKNQSC